MLGWGLLLGLVMALVSICCALFHGDVRFYFDASPRQIPVFAFALLSVFLQSATEEMYFRGFLYERLHTRYPLWVPLLVNGVLFGAGHILSDNASVLSVIETVIGGSSYALLRWYAGNIWIVMGVHTAWNFTQSFLFGLPTSGIAAQFSLFRADALSGVGNLIYDPGFGLEGSLPILCIDLILCAVCLLLASRSGRLKELGWNRSRTMETV